MEDDIIKSFTKKIEIKLIKQLEDIPIKICTNALGNLLIRLCQKNSVNKKHFFELMGNAWDYHKEETEE